MTTIGQNFENFCFSRYLLKMNEFLKIIMFNLYTVQYTYPEAVVLSQFVLIVVIGTVQTYHIPLHKID